MVAAMSGEPCTRDAALQAATKLGDPSSDGFVLRHGGRLCDRWKQRGSGLDEFEALERSLRQGGVALVMDGKLQRFAYSPRRRW